MGAVARGWSLGKRVAPPRFVIFLVLFAAGVVAARSTIAPREWLEPIALGFDLAALVFLVSLLPLLRDFGAAEMRKHSNANDANRAMVLVITTLVTFAVMAAVSGELKDAQAGDPFAIAKLVGTLLLIWLFANSVYGVHYAHLFYAKDEGTGKDAAGIDFPGTKTPDYRDFFYFAGTLGMTFQTSDVAITSARIRHVALFHSFAAFVFNIGVIAFTINTLGGGSG